jgi:parallel beta-helix repeat protein
MLNNSPLNQDASIDNTRLAVRRKVLTSLIAGGGAAVLAACGGGSDPSSLDSVANRQRRGGAGAATGASSASTPAAASAPTAASSTAAASTSTAGTISASNYGVKADGITNDRVALQNAINQTVGQILLISGTVRIDAAGLTLHTNTHIRFAAGAMIQMLPHNSNTYEMFRLWDVNNVILESPYLDAAKSLNRAGSGEWGMGISLQGATNCTITSPTTLNCWGDGIYFINSDSTGKPSSNITINNHHASGCRRQGVSIVSGNGITFNSPVWENIGGTAPGAGLDIEPNDNTAVLQNIKINSPTTRNCAGGGIISYLGFFPGPVAKTVSVAITNHVDTSSPGGTFAVQGLQPNGYSVTGTMTSTNPTWWNPMSVEDWDSSAIKVTATGQKMVAKTSS